MKSNELIKSIIKDGIKDIIKLIAVSIVVFFAFSFVIFFLFMVQMEKVSIASYPSPAGLGNAIFVNTGGLFTNRFLAIDLTPNADGDEFIVGRIHAADFFSFYGADISKDGTVIAIRSGVGHGYDGILYPFTHAYDFKTQTMISLPNNELNEETEESATLWVNLDIRITNLLKERGGEVSLEWDHRSELKKTSLSKSKKWNKLISEFKNNK